jgi:hypothetical protein
MTLEERRVHNVDEAGDARQERGDEHAVYQDLLEHHLVPPGLFASMRMHRRYTRKVPGGA